MTSGMQIAPLRRADIPRIEPVSHQRLRSARDLLLISLTRFSHGSILMGRAVPRKTRLAAWSRARRARSSGTSAYVPARSSYRETEGRPYRPCTPSIGSAPARIPPRRLPDAAGLHDLQDAVRHRWNRTGAGSLPKVGLRAEAEDRDISQSAGAIPSLAHDGAGVLPQMDGNSQGRGFRLARLDAAGVAEPRIAPGADVHRRNRLPATAVFTTHGDVPARSLAAQLFPSLSIAGLYGLDDSRIRANDRHRHLEDHSARPNPAWQDRGLLARHRRSVLLAGGNRGAHQSPARPCRGHCHLFCLDPGPARGIALEWIRQNGGKKRVPARQTAMRCPAIFLSASRCSRGIMPFSSNGLAATRRGARR